METSVCENLSKVNGPLLLRFFLTCIDETPLDSGCVSTGLTWHPLPSDAMVLNGILDSAILRRDATVEEALRTAAWRASRNVPNSYVPTLKIL